MHKTTIENLEKAKQWTLDICRADEIMVALDDAMPTFTEESGTFASISNNFGDVAVFVYDALAIADAGPFLTALRQIGFRRQGEPTLNETDGTMEWTYTRGEYADGDRQRVAVKLTLKKAEAEGTAPSCQYVQVGTKEVPDMKLLCGEELEAFQAERAGL